MKTTKTMLACIAGAVILTGTGCDKDMCHKKEDTKNTPAPTEEINNAVSELKVAYSNAKIYNDSLKEYAGNTATVADSSHHTQMVQHCDAMYHQYDSLFTENHNTCHQAGYCHGDGSGMMSGGMTGGGMMGNNSGTETHNLDCEVDGMQCCAAMDSLRAGHVHVCMQ